MPEQHDRVCGQPPWTATAAEMQNRERKHSCFTNNNALNQSQPNHRLTTSPMSEREEFS